MNGEVVPIWTFEGRFWVPCIWYITILARFFCDIFIAFACIFQCFSCFWVWIGLLIVYYTIWRSEYVICIYTNCPSVITTSESSRESCGCIALIMTHCYFAQIILWENSEEMLYLQMMNLVYIWNSNSTMKNLHLRIMSCFYVSYNQHPLLRVRIIMH